VIGLAWVAPDQAEEGTEIAVRIERTLHAATVTLAPFYDPTGDRLRS